MISYSTANFLLGRVSLAAPYWGSFGVDLVALAIAGTGAVRLREYASRGADTAQATPSRAHPD